MPWLIVTGRRLANDRYRKIARRLGGLPPPLHSMKPNKCAGWMFSRLSRTCQRSNGPPWCWSRSRGCRPLRLPDSSTRLQAAYGSAQPRPREAWRRPMSESRHDRVWRDWKAMADGAGQPAFAPRDNQRRGGFPIGLASAAVVAGADRSDAARYWTPQVGGFRSVWLKSAGDTDRGGNGHYRTLAPPRRHCHRPQLPLRSYRAPLDRGRSDGGVDRHEIPDVHQAGQLCDRMGHDCPSMEVRHRRRWLCTVGGQLGGYRQVAGHNRLRVADPLPRLAAVGPKLAGAASVDPSG